MGAEGKLQDFLLLFQCWDPQSSQSCCPDSSHAVSGAPHSPALGEGVTEGSKPSAFYTTFIKHHLTLSVPIKACEVHAR